MVPQKMIIRPSVNKDWNLTHPFEKTSKHKPDIREIMQSVVKLISPTSGSVYAKTRHIAKKRNLKPFKNP